MKKVIAIVVTHNRHQLLVECINALRAQTQPLDKILVVNNGSSDYTGVWLDKQEDLIHIYQENMGPAGGYHTGLKWAYDNGYTWMWCMDDDGYPQKNALENLLINRGNELSLVNSLVVDKDNKQTLVYQPKNNQLLVDVNESSIEGMCQLFNGTMFHRDIITKAGFPQSAMCYCGGELEYYYRIVNRHQISSKTIPQSIQYHPSTQYSNKKEWDCGASWKIYFHIRNRFQVFQSKYRLKSVALVAYLFFIGGFLWSIIRHQKKDRIRKMVFVFWPMRDGLSGKWDATPFIIETKMRKQSEKSVTHFVLSPLKRKLFNSLVVAHSDAAITI